MAGDAHARGAQGDRAQGGSRAAGESGVAVLNEFDILVIFIVLMLVSNWANRERLSR